MNLWPTIEHHGTKATKKNSRNASFYLPATGLHVLYVLFLEFLHSTKDVFPKLFPTILDLIYFLDILCFEKSGKIWSINFLFLLDLMLCMGYLNYLT